MSPQVDQVEPHGRVLVHVTEHVFTEGRKSLGKLLSVLACQALDHIGLRHGIPAAGAQPVEGAYVVFAVARMV